MRGPSLEDSLMGVGRGYSAYVLGTRNIFLFRSAKQERETKLERGSAGTLNLRTRKKLFIQENGNAKAKLRNNGARERKAFQEYAPISAQNVFAQFDWLRTFNPCLF